MIGCTKRTPRPVVSMDMPDMCLQTRRTKHQGMSETTRIVRCVEILVTERWSSNKILWLLNSLLLGKRNANLYHFHVFSPLKLYSAWSWNYASIVFTSNEFIWEPAANSTHVADHMRYQSECSWKKVWSAEKHLSWRRRLYTQRRYIYPIGFFVSLFLCSFY